MRLFFFILVAIFATINLHALERTWENTVTGVKEDEIGYTILFSIPDKIRATFSHNAKTSQIFVLKEERISETAERIYKNLTLSKDVFPYAIILIDDNQLDEFSWEEIIKINKQVFNERKKSDNPYIPSFQVVLHQYY